MLDHLRLAIPFSKVFVKEHDNQFSLLGDPSDYGFLMASRHVSKDEDGKITVGELFHPYESLPSSYASMAVKLYNVQRNALPCVEIKGSPAKIMQGHNVYGSESIEHGAMHMIGLLLESIPSVAKYLDLENIQVRHLDVTYSSRVQHPEQIPKIIDYLSRISKGQTKPTADKKYQTTAYWGGQTSRLVQMKCYSKASELKYQIDNFTKQAKHGCAKSKKLLDEVYTSELLDFASNLLRWEARIKARKLDRLGLPTNLLDLIQHQNQNPSCLRDLWHLCFTPIFNNLEGQTMPYATDDELYDILKKNSLPPLKLVVNPMLKPTML